MPKIAKRFFIAAGAVIGAFALILLGINLYLQSGGVQQRIRTAASKALGSEVKIRSTLYLPWSGLVLRGITVPDPTAPERTIIEAGTLRVRFRFFPLFQQRFVVSECALFEPKVTVRQQENGEWLLPFPAKPKERPATEPEGPTAPRVAGPAFRAEVERFRMGGGTVEFIDAKNRTVLTLEKATAAARLTSMSSADGEFEVGRVIVSNRLKPRKVGGPFAWKGKVLELPAIHGLLAGGEVTGSYRLDNGREPSFALKVQLQDVVLKKLVDEAGIDPGRTSGTLQGTLAIEGNPRDSRALFGQGDFQLNEAKLRPFEFLVKIGELMQVEELQMLQLSDARVQMEIRDQKVVVQEAVLKSENLILTGTGPVRFNGKMNLDARLLINSKLQQQFRGLLGDNFKPSTESGYSELPFTVTGKLDSPKTDLLEKVTGIDDLGQDVGGFFKSIIRAIPTQTPRGTDQQN